MAMAASVGSATIAGEQDRVLGRRPAITRLRDRLGPLGELDDQASMLVILRSADPEVCRQRRLSSGRGSNSHRRCRS
jgi:hypothetical protein